ncbi:DNA-binding protein [Streptomyces candidus]|uniref:DNA-binding protein n=1 Tax=Streptomyces candidus TaxID=67283 RepID=A0A7X0HLY6_9ACTN|nr:DNA-binding protein [Streptomyces candidus]MBB6440094.1 hypothetical protein [Streptomyces candidus]GHH58234.1 hypothetical protein GCM10018773_66330 [Streptomyces candidus]
MASRDPILVVEADAVYYTRRPASTIRRWAHEGRIQRYGSGRGKVRYNVNELPAATTDEWTGEVTLGDPPPLPGRQSEAA